MSPVQAPLRSSSALVAVVVPWTTIYRSSGVAEASASAARTPSAWLPTLVGTLATRTAPVVSSTSTRSVKVPPTSTPTSRAGPEVTNRSSTAAAGRSQSASACPEAVTRARITTLFSGLREGVMMGTEADVLGADDRRFEAMRKGDWAALDAALADDLVYVHSTARVESKAEHIANLRAGKPHYRGIAPRERKARVIGNVGLVNGVSEMHVENAGKDNRFTIRYLAVYVKNGQNWRMTAWQSTKVP